MVHSHSTLKKISFEPSHVCLTSKCYYNLKFFKPFFQQLQNQHPKLHFDAPKNQCCGSRMFIPDPGSWFLPIPDLGSRIPDLGSKNRNKREGWKKICYTFFCSHKFHKIVNYFIFEMLKKKLSQSSQKYGFGIRKKPILDPGPGVKKAPDHGSATLLKIFVEDNVGIFLNVEANHTWNNSKAKMYLKCVCKFNLHLSPDSSSLHSKEINII